MPRNYSKMSMEELLSWVDAQISGEQFSPQSFNRKRKDKERLQTTEQASEGPDQGIEPDMDEGVDSDMDQEIDSNITSDSKPSSHCFGPVNLAFNSQSLLQGILFSEILGKPRSKRPIRYRSQT